jgi:hypothetical protein
MTTMDSRTKLEVDKKLIGKSCHFYHDTHDTLYTGTIIGNHMDKHYIIEFINPGKGPFKTYVLPNNVISI